MTANAPQDTEYSGSIDLRDLPKSVWVGLVIGVLGFFVSIGSSSQTTVNGVQTACSSTDFGGFIAAVICLVCIPVAWSSRNKMHVARRTSTWMMVAASVVLLGLAVVQALHGLGMIGGPCN